MQPYQLHTPHERDVVAELHVRRHLVRQEVRLHQRAPVVEQCAPRALRQLHYLVQGSRVVVEAPALRVHRRPRRDVSLRGHPWYLPPRHPCVPTHGGKRRRSTATTTPPVRGGVLLVGPEINLLPPLSLDLKLGPDQDRILSKGIV